MLTSLQGLSFAENRELGTENSYCTPVSGSIAPCRRSNCGRFCENADLGNAMSQPTSCAFCFRSPCTWDRNPMIEVPFFSLLLSLGIRVRGFALALFRSKIIRDGFPLPLV